MRSSVPGKKNLTPGKGECHVKKTAAGNISSREIQNFIKQRIFINRSILKNFAFFRYIHKNIMHPSFSVNFNLNMFYE